MFQKKKKKTADIDLSFQKKNITDWTVRDVGMWLRYCNLDEYQEAFFFNEVDGEMLLDIDDDDLIAIPIEKIAHRKKILRKIGILVGRPPSSSSFTSRSMSSMTGGFAAFSDDGTMTDCTSLSEDKVHIKCVYHSDIRTFTLQPLETFEEFARKIEEEFGHHKSAKYQDEEGDLLTIRNTEDIRAVIRASRVRKVRLIIFTHRKSKHSKEKKKRSRSKKKSSNSSVTEEGDVLEHFVDAVAISNRRGIITFFNAAAETMFGWPREEVIGKNVSILMVEAVGSRHNAYMRRYRREGNSKIIGQNRRVQGLHQNGEVFDLYITLSESSRSFTATMKLIPKKGAEAPIVEQLQKKKENTLEGIASELNALEEYRESIIVVDSEGTIHYANKIAHAELDYEPKGLVGLSVSTICDAIRSEDESHDLLFDYQASKDDPNRTRELLDDKNRRCVICLNSKRQFRAYEAEFSDLSYRDHQLYTIHLRKQGVTSKSAVAASASILDIQRDVISSLVVPGIILDSDSIIQGTNLAFSELFGWSFSELLGRSVNMLIPPGDVRDNHLKWMKNYARTGRGRSSNGTSEVVGKGREVIAMKKNETQIRVQLSVSVIQNSDEKIFIGIVQYRGDVEAGGAGDVQVKSQMLDVQVQVISSLAIPACIITGDSVIRAFNQSCQDLFGYSLKEVEFQKVELLMPPGEIQEKHETFVHNFVSGKKNPSESIVVGKGRRVIGRHKNGHNISIMISVTQRRDGDVVIFTAIFTP